MQTLDALVSMLTGLVAALTAIWSAAVGTLALILATIGAVSGFHAWRRELRGTTKYHAALKILQSVYRLRQSLHRTREPGDPLDPHGRPLNDPENGNVYLARNLWVQYTARLRTLTEHVAQLIAAEHDALPLLGAEAGVPLARLYTISGNLRNWSEQYFPSEVIRAGEEPQPDRTATMERLNRCLYFQGETDFYSRQIEDAVRDAIDAYAPLVL